MSTPLLKSIPPWPSFPFLGRASHLNPPKPFNRSLVLTATMGDGPLDLEFFADNGFHRRRCPACGHHYWAQPDERGGFVHGELCGDSPCVEYSFLGAPVIPEAHDLDSMRELYLSFFEKRGHTRMTRYPVVARWRTDIYLTIASIADFQPHVTSGLVPPPANPLTISQPCIRLNDMASVGRSGRHLTNFEMMAHHAFNTPTQKVYWQNETVRLCHELYSDELNIKPELITYKENPWVGGGNGGQALEVLAGGLELATLVFMNLAEDPRGPIELKGQRFAEQELSIVDTGYGLERMVWASSGTPTLYEAIYPDIVRFVSQQAGVAELLADPTTARIIGLNARIAGVLNVDLGTNLATLREQVLARLRQEGLKLSMDELLAAVEPLERVFAVTDHARCLTFMFGDGVVPSSVKSGYLARMVARRTLGLLEQLGCPELLPQLIDIHLKGLANFPKLKQRRDHILAIVELEADRYKDTLDRGRRAVSRYLAENPVSGFGVEQLIHFYESAGLPPQVVAQEAASRGVQVEVPADFTAQVAVAHSREEASQSEESRVSFDLPPTEPLYYARPPAPAFESRVLWSQGDRVVLEATGFYPEGGGQPCDLGILAWQGQSSRVLDVQKQGKVIVHTLEGPAPPVGTVVKGEVDWRRRMAHVRHHTGAHIVGAAARHLLGSHIWQAGASKTADRARLDLTHYQRLSPDQLNDIERMANEIILADEPVEHMQLPRAEADARFGHVLYQGGVPPGSKIRVLRIGEDDEHIVDVQACGGTHAMHTGEIGYLKLLGTTRVQEGVERLEFAAGPAAVARVQEREAWLREAADELGVPVDRLPATAHRFFQEWKERGKEVERLQKELAKGGGSGLTSQEIGGVTVHWGVRQGAAMAELQSMARELTAEPGSLALLGAVPNDPNGSSPKGMILAAVSEEVPEGLHCGKLMQAGAQAGGGKGGGKPNIAQGACPAEGVEAAVAAMVEAARKQLGA